MEIKNVDVYGLYKSVVRSGYPMMVGDVPDLNKTTSSNIQEQDKTRGSKLGKCKSGSGHDNFLKGVVVQFDLKYPQYFTPQLQRYNWIDIISSQSKMHRLTHNKLSDDNCSKYVLNYVKDVLNALIDIYNNDNFEYPKYFCISDSFCGNAEDLTFENKKELFNVILSNLPMGYEMWMGISTNYLQLKTIYNQRKNHKLEEWDYFCKWIEGLPMFKELCIK